MDKLPLEYFWPVSLFLWRQLFFHDDISQLCFRSKRVYQSFSCFPNHLYYISCSFQWLLSLCFDITLIIVVVVNFDFWIHAGFTLVGGDQWLHVLWPKPTSWWESWRKTVGSQTFLFITFVHLIDGSRNLSALQHYPKMVVQKYCHLFCLS